MHPTLVRRLILPLHERLVGRPTTEHLRALLNSDRWPRGRLLELQVRKLRALLVHAYARCPGHRRRIDRFGIHPGRADLGALTRLPTLTKDDLRDAGRGGPGPFCDPTVPGGLIRSTTGGSTGDPLIFCVDRARQAADQAARARSRTWFDVQPGQREFYLWGAPVELSAQDRLRQWRDRCINHRLVSAFDMTPRRLDLYLDALERFDPAHLFGYPSSLATLAARARQIERRLRLPSLRAAFVTGEVLLPADRAAIRDAFNVAVADGYGSREAGFIAHECPAGRMHVAMESVVVELLDDDGRAVPDGDSGEITVTHLDARGMPFIRYRTGDTARLDPRPCPCGRESITLAGIDGRRGDAIRTPDGGVAHPLSAIYPIRECPHVRRFCVVQRADLSLHVSVVPATGFSESLRRNLAEKLARQFHRQLPVEVVAVAEIPPDPSGKHRVVRAEVIAAPSQAAPQFP